jgi:outer membrane receptor protein involved in Fe transport
VLLGGGLEVRAQDTLVGTPIIDFIESVRERGITIIYSSDLVAESMQIVSEPNGADPIRQLEQALAPYGLALAPGPRRSWLVVKAAPVSATPPPAEALPTPTIPAPTLDTVVVTASQYAFSRSTAASAERLDRMQLENSPTLGEDALRTTHAVPGVTSSGLTARSNARGGEADETLVLLDSVRLYDPFHLKDFQSLFGSIDPRIIELIDVRTGGYPAEYGDRMSAVIEMHSLEPAARRHFEVGVSTLSSSVLSSGRFGDDRGEWLTSARRGNLDLWAERADTDIGEPQYNDFFNKVSYELDGGLVLTTGILTLDDKITLKDDDISTATADYDDSYLWVELEHNLAASLTARYLIVHAQLDSERTGQIDDPDIAIGTLDDGRQFQIDTLKGDWSLAIGDRQRVEWGIELDRADAAYAFVSQRQLPYPIRVQEVTATGDAVSAALELDDRRFSAYASYRTQPTSRLTAEIGARWDDRSYLDEDHVSPRLAVLFDVGARTTLRASWGRFFQDQGINEVQIGDGSTTLFPAQEAEHSVLSFEYAFSDSLALRAEAYKKEFEHVRPRFENLFMRVSLLPELLPDRVMIEPLHARAEGIELSLEARRDDWQWWVSFTRSSVDDRLPARWASRSWEEPWATKAGAVWLGARWTASANLTARAGWPISELALVGTELVAGPYNTQAFESFRSLDLRASRTFKLKRGRLEVFMELTNALDQKNPCCFDYSLETNAALEPVNLTIDLDNWLPEIPTVGFLWQL